MVNNIASLYWVVVMMMISCVEVYGLSLSLCLSSKELVHLVLILLVTIYASKTSRIVVLRDNDVGDWLYIQH